MSDVALGTWQVCTSPDEARQWVERQATALGIPVEWVSAAPQRQG